MQPKKESNYEMFYASNRSRKDLMQPCPSVATKRILWQLVQKISADAFLDGSLFLTEGEDESLGDQLYAKYLLPDERTTVGVTLVSCYPDTQLVEIDRKKRATAERYQSKGKRLAMSSGETLRLLNAMVCEINIRTQSRLSRIELLPSCSASKTDRLACETWNLIKVVENGGVNYHLVTGPAYMVGYVRTDEGIVSPVPFIKAAYIMDRLKYATLTKNATVRTHSSARHDILSNLVTF